MEKRKIKIKKLPIIISLVIIILLSGISLLLVKIHNDKILKTMKENYNKYVITTKKTTLYNKKNKEIGTITKNFPLELTSIKIKDTSKKYYNIKDTNYYIYYEDIKSNKNNVTNTDTNTNYIVFNKNIKTTKKTTLYKNNKEVITINNGEFPIEYIDKDNYYINLQNNILKVKKNKSIKEVNSNNTKEVETNHVSVLYYEKIDTNCSDYNCTTIDNFKSQLNSLKDNKYYTINLDEYKKYLSGFIHLKDKAILITTSNNNDELNNIKNELKVNIELIDENTNIPFNSTNKTTNTNTNKDSVDRYQIKSYTTIDNLIKMANGEEVKEAEPVVIKNTNNGEQGIAVLNYHFFYDSSLGEGCNESICLDTSKFREQLNYLKENNYKTLTMEEFKKWMYGEIELPTKSVLITIDDGALGTGAHNGNKLIPLLEEYKMHATLFLITGWWDINNYKSPYLTIQSHTNDMHQYGSCGRGQINCATYEEAKADLQKSLDIIGNSDSFCFPFYMYSDTSLRAVKDLGFKLSFVGGNRKATRSSNKYLVPRYPIHSDITLNRFIQIVS